MRDGSVIQGVPDTDGEVFVVSPRRHVGRKEGVRVAVRGAYLESVKLSWDRRSGPRASRRRVGPCGGDEDCYAPPRPATAFSVERRVVSYVSLGERLGEVAMVLPE